METTEVEIDALVARFIECAPRLSSEGKRIAIALYRCLAEGSPVRPDELAAKVGLEARLVQRRLRSWPGVIFDAQGNIQGYWGLSIPKTNHRFEVGGTTLYTQKSASVRSTCPVTGEVVRLRVHPDEIESVDPADVVMSFPRVDCMALGEEIIANFCRFVHFFRSSEAARRWVSKETGHVILSLENAFALAWRKNTVQFGEFLSTAQS
jgi:alkylmercury lyase